jgi:hypothetical protein
MEARIITKFNIGDEVYIRTGQWYQKAVVCHVQATWLADEKFGEHMCEVSYRLKTPNGEPFPHDFWERRLQSKEEILKNYD